MAGSRYGPALVTPGVRASDRRAYYPERGRDWRAGTVELMAQTDHAGDSTNGSPRQRPPERPPLFLGDASTLGPRREASSGDHAGKHLRVSAVAFLLGTEGRTVIHP
ncbi:hypothetical protein Xph01_05320 [Micromonospora phaseoli]|nr:hypothetical protein Xph01_05320 [Micromonospora phaseoli]